MESLPEDFQVEHKNPSMRWRRAVVILNNRGRRFHHIAYLAKQKEAERKKQFIQRLKSSGPFILALIYPFFIQAINLCRSHLNGWLRFFKKESLEVDISTGEKETSEIQPCSDFPATSPDSYYSCVDAEPDDDGAVLRNKIEVWELIFFLANFIVELMAIVFEQLSSQHKHKARFLLLSLTMSISAVLIGISELLHKLKKERDFSKGVTNRRSWLFIPPPGVRVGLFLCIIALTCALGQFVIATVNYSWYRKHGKDPIKISVWPAIFAFGQLFSLVLRSWGAKTENHRQPSSAP